MFRGAWQCTRPSLHTYGTTLCWVSAYSAPSGAVLAATTHCWRPHGAWWTLPFSPNSCWAECHSTRSSGVATLKQRTSPVLGRLPPTRRRPRYLPRLTERKRGGHRAQLTRWAQGKYGSSREEQRVSVLMSTPQLPRRQGVGAHHCNRSVTIHPSMTNSLSMPYG